jgi:Tol biopolymer transport system component
MSEAVGIMRQKGGLRRLAGPAVLALSLIANTAGAATGERIELVSKGDSPAGAPSGPSTLGKLSADGRYVVFASPATDLLPGQNDKPYRPGDITPGSWDIFLRDRATGKTTMVSHASSSAVTGGQIGNGDDDSFSPAISGDGRYVVFASGRQNLVPGQTGRGRNIFLYDRLLNTTQLVSHKKGSTREGTNGFSVSSPPVLSADGRFVVYTSDGRGVVSGHDDLSEMILLYDRTTGLNTFVGAVGRHVTMSADGRFVVFYDNDFQIRLYDRLTGTTTLVSHAAGSPQVPANDQSSFVEISADGSAVVYTSWATDLVAGQTDTSRTTDLFLYDRASGQTSLLSRSAASPTGAAGGEPSEPSLSADGRWITFYSTANNMVPGVTDTNGDYDVFLYDRSSGSMKVVSHPSGSSAAAANRRSAFPAISADGSRIAFTSAATDLASLPSGSEGWTSLFLQDRITGTNTFAGLMTRQGLPAPLFLSINPWISADGRAIAFGSASALVPGDANTDWDVYLYGAEASPGGPGTFVPCTFFDTRGAADGPALRSNVRRVVIARGTCGVPSTARSVSVNVTVLQATGKGNLQFYPGNLRKPSSGILRFQKGATRTESFNLPLATNGAGTLAILPFVAGNGTVHVAVEVTGYSE